MRERILDLSALAPPEPFERVVAALASLTDAERLRVRFPREPLPLYAWLERHEFDWRRLPGDSGTCELLIWPRSNTSAARPP